MSRTIRLTLLEGVPVTEHALELSVESLKRAEVDKAVARLVEAFEKLKVVRRVI